ncbi:AraC family transcriptional regulator [Flavobacterium sp. RSP15]|uniref:AraC family transcriptional regulator n=1 Tax=Flavobacterium sp. RSP15 TaxID=2497485 RepID=UPI000F84E4D5|nr:AraC family transcriptional regulator [Flavobacterium sp. RSP15]RTY86227.1 AraC family transcriptional regulator [Flavobacterium sp. RSP15]
MTKKGAILRELVSISEDDFFIVLNHTNAKFDFPLHFHPEIELNLVLNSSGKRIVGDSIMEYVDCDLVLIGSNTPHVWSGLKENQEAHVITIQFHEDLFSTKTLSRKLAIPIRELLERSKRGVLFSKETIETLKLKIIQLSDSQDFGSLLDFLSILYDLSIAKNTKMLSSHSYIDYYSFPESRRVEKANNFIKENLRTKIQLKEVADLVNMSESAFSHFFKKSTRSSFSDYITDLRLGLAAKLLFESEESIKEICYESGFNNISNFNRTFKRKLGLTPSDFRDQRKLITKH